MSFVPDDYIQEIVDSTYDKLRRGKCRSVIEEAINAALVEVFEEVGHRLADISYETPSTLLDDMIEDVDEALRTYG